MGGWLDCLGLWFWLGKDISKILIWTIVRGVDKMIFMDS